MTLLCTSSAATGHNLSAAFTTLSPKQVLRLSNKLLVLTLLWFTTSVREGEYREIKGLFNFFIQFTRNRSSRPTHLATILYQSILSQEFQLPLLSISCPSSPHSSISHVWFHGPCGQFCISYIIILRSSAALHLSISLSLTYGSISHVWYRGPWCQFCIQ